VSSFDWHGGQITRATPITKSYRNTQKVRRFFEAECGSNFKLDRAFIAWLKDGTEKTMGEAADEWHRREAAKRRKITLWFRESEDFWTLCPPKSRQWVYALHKL
jgi:Domain of unknown function (DUF6434)